MPKKGPMKVRSVRDVDWVGWNKMQELVEKAEKTRFETGDIEEKQHRAKGLILIGFKTGGRISEILPLTKDRFSFKGEFWTVTLPLVKKYKKTKTVEKWKCDKCDRRWADKPIKIMNKDAKDWRLECREGGQHKILSYEGYRASAKDESREIEWHCEELLNEELKEYIESCQNLLFPHHKDKSKPMKRAYAYTLITGVDDGIWPHWLRAQRACQLADELDFELEERQDWFEWEDDEYPRLYGSRKYEMRDKMKKPKRRIK